MYYNTTYRGDIMTKQGKTEKKIEKRERKEANRTNEVKVRFKCTVWKCISIIICCIMVCSTAVKCTDKYVKKLETIAENQAYQQQNPPVDNTDVSSDVNTDIDVTDPTEESTLPEGESTTKTGSTSAGDKSSSKSTTKTNSNGSGEMTKAEIISLFNKASNNAKASSKSITQNYCVNTLASSVEISNKTLASLANKLIDANMGKDESQSNITYSNRNDINKYYPVENQSWSSKLTQSDVKNATIKESNGIYTIVIELYDDTTPNIPVGGGHAGKAFSVIEKKTILDNAGAAKALIDEDSIKLTFRNCKVKVTVDKKTGKLLTSNYYMIWRLALNALGIDVAVSFGLEEDFKINW